MVRHDLENRNIHYLAILVALALGILNSIVYYGYSDAINIIAFAISALVFLALNRALLLDMWKIIKIKIKGRES